MHRIIALLICFVVSGVVLAESPIEYARRVGRERREMREIQERVARTARPLKKSMSRGSGATLSLVVDGEVKFTGKVVKAKALKSYLL